MNHALSKLRAPLEKKVSLNEIDPAETHGLDKQGAAAALAKHLERLSVLQYVLYAEGRRAVLAVLQGIDAAGKDGTIRRVMTGLNPQGVRVKPFKAPEGAEKRHDYLWRIHRALPEYGQIGIFNRSHYEDVLVVRVHGLVPKSVWSKRYRQINEFERMLSESGVTIVKFLLYISKQEQAKRFQERLDDKKKNWKFSPDDLKEREYWDAYIEAYDEVLEKCNTEYAPWYIIPANYKWFRNLAVAQILVETMEAMKLRYPKPATDLSGIRFE
ncbi:MAG TPA: polyphosphate kinase 2 family protein [Bryobacteraceae bacterium]|jgi:PPK2 family polyphosphate:nucleotide phosphotransferase